jgi:membrane protein YqaA with SNARE-associated domain
MRYEMTRAPEPTTPKELTPKPAPAQPQDAAPKVRDAAPSESFQKEPDAVRSYMIRNLIYLVVGVVALVGLAYLAQRYLGHHLEAASRWLTNTGGYSGVFISIWLIDTFTLPVSPDMILAFVAHKGSTLNTPVALVVICIASIAAGNTGYHLAKRIGDWPFIQRRLAKSYKKGHKLFDRFGVWTVVIAGITPLPFSIVCWFAGLYEMKSWPFFLATLSRIPRFIGWYYLLRLGFSL